MILIKEIIEKKFIVHHLIKLNKRTIKKGQIIKNLKNYFFRIKKRKEYKQ